MPALAAAAAAVAAASACCALVVPALQRHRTHRGVARIPLREFLSFHARVRWQSLLLWASGVSSTLEVLSDVAAIAPHVLRIMGQNPSRMTLRGTNTYLVGDGAKRILIDASDGNDKYMATLLRVCRDAGVTEITDVLLTHGHYDHMGGILRVKEEFPSARVWKYLPPDDSTLRVSNAESALLGVKHLADGATFPVATVDADAPALVLRAVYTPGHYNDHMCFFLEDSTQQEAQPALFSGDCILGAGSCVFDSLRELMASLALLQARGPYVIFPGHGPVVQDAAAKIREYITHREQREQEVLAALTAAASASSPSSASSRLMAGLSVAEIVRRIYTSLPFALQLAARKAVDKHLHKLVLDGRVVRIDGSHSSWWRRLFTAPAPTYRLA